MIYFDYASGSPVDDRVIEAMLLYMRDHFGNPSSIHSLGFKARQAVEDAREKVLSLINGESGDLIFTSGATEANNLAIIGYAMRNSRKGRHILVSSVEHMSIINPAKFLQKQNFEVEFIPVDKYGVVDVEFITERVREDTILVSVQHANNEIGTIQPIEEISSILEGTNVAFHVDATASLGKIEVDAKKLGADMITVSSNDIYGPRGAGGLFVRDGVRIQPIILGGGQERGVRSGTENVAAIVGFGVAADCQRMDKRCKENRKVEK